MKIAIRNKEVFVESRWQTHFKNGDRDLTQDPYNYTIVEVEVPDYTLIKASHFIENVFNRELYDNDINKNVLDVELREIESYLTQTDWVVIKNYELGTINHQDILDLRTSKRVRQQEIQTLLV